MQSDENFCHSSGSWNPANILRGNASLRSRNIGTSGLRIFSTSVTVTILFSAQIRLIRVNLCSILHNPSFFIPLFHVAINEIKSYVLSLYSLLSVLSLLSALKSSFFLSDLSALVVKISFSNHVPQVSSFLNSILEI